MRAVIVAAGRSTRLYPHTLDLPKPLLKINGQTILERSIDNLRRKGIEEIAVVVGYLKEKILQALGNRVELIHNPFYAFSNNLASLWCARDFIRGEDFLYLHGDLIYHPDILGQCLQNDEDMVLVVEKKEVGEEDMKVRVENDRLVESGKEIALSQAYGEWIGLAKFSRQGGEFLFKEMADILAGADYNTYDTSAFTALAQKGHKIQVCHTRGFPWMEIDFAEQLEQAKNVFNL